MIQKLIPHFSRKVLFLAIIFLLANVGITSLRLNAEPQATQSATVPVLSIEAGQLVEYQLPFTNEFQNAESGIEIFSGTVLKTEAGQSAELVFGTNSVRLDEETELVLIENTFLHPSSFRAGKPRMTFELRQGGVFVDASDQIDVRTPQSTTSFQNGLGIVTYTEPMNRVMALTGDAELSLRDGDNDVVGTFILPLANQVTFIDPQLTKVYSSLQPSKLRKELKMTPVADEVLQDEWVADNLDEVMETQLSLNESLIDSGVAYSIQNGASKLLSWLSFREESKAELAAREVSLKLRYILGGLEDERDTEKATELFEEIDNLAQSYPSTAMSRLLTQTLFDIKDVSLGTPSFLLRDFLMDELLASEGANVYRLYLTDLRKFLVQEDLMRGESILKRWDEKWTAKLTQDELSEFKRQSQILNHTLLSHADKVNMELLNIFDETGLARMELEDDMEEARFEVIQERLQIATRLVTEYRYSTAKLYLKNSYLSLNIEGGDASLPSTQIFLERGRLLAQRIEYAQSVLHGAAQPIDEAKFREYFQARTRDEALSDDLRAFFDLQEAETQTFTEVEAPSVAEVADKFDEAGVNVNYTDISLVEDFGFYYNVKNARLKKRGPDNETLAFDATFDFTTGSVTDVIAAGSSIKGAFVLEDLVELLLSGGELADDVYQPGASNGIDLLITDQEKAEAEEGQALAQDLAKKLAVTQLADAGIIVPDVKLNIDIIDEVNLDKFEINNALIARPDEQGTVAIDFTYFAATGQITKVETPDGVVLLSLSNLETLAVDALKKVSELEKEIETVSSFTTFAKQNELYIDEEDITYTAENLLLVSNLEMLNLGLSVDGLFDTETETFVSVSNDLYSAQDVKLKVYFNDLADRYLIALMASNGISIQANQIGATYPFRSISLNGVELSGYNFSFKIDPTNLMLTDIQRLGDSGDIDDMSIEELQVFASVLRQQEDAAAAAAQEAENE